MGEMQDALYATAIYPKEAKTVYPALGLAGELGEFLELLVESIWPTPECARGLLECNIYATFQNLIKAAKDCERLKKVIRDTKVYEQDMFERLEEKVADGLFCVNREDLMAEFGDFSAWYNSALASDLGFRLSKVFKKNLEKVESRKRRGVVHGSGSNR